MKFHRWLSVWPLILVGLAIAWRAPLVWLEPRFWAEEGMLYFAYARQQGFWASLFVVPTSDFPAGYLLLAASLSAKLATLVPLELAPRITTLFAFCVQLAPFCVVLFGNSALWQRREHRLLLCSVLLLSPAVVGEVWLNTINSQVFCGLTAALIAVSDPWRASAKVRLSFRGLLLFCGLNGPYTAFLVPIFAIRAYWERGSEALTQLRLILFTTLVQASIFLWTLLVFPLAPERFESGRWALRSAAAAYHFMIRPLLGDQLGLEMAELVGLREPLGTIAEAYWLSPTSRVPGAASIFTGLVGIALLIAGVAWLGRRSHRYAHLLTAAMLVSGALTTLSIGHLYPAGRYAVVPGTLFLLRIAIATWDCPAPRRRSYQLALAVALTVGLFTFRMESPPGAFGKVAGRPSWSEEVARWQSDAGYRLRIWAYNLDVPNRLLLTRQPKEGADWPALESQPFRLVSTGDWVTRTFHIEGLPQDFRLVVDFTASRSADQLELVIRWLDAQQQVVKESAIQGFAAGSPFRFVTGNLPLGEQSRRRIVAGELAMRSSRAGPAQLEVGRLRISRRLEGALEPIFATLKGPTRAGKSQQLYSAEASAWAMAESLARDGDLRFDLRDLERVRERWPAGARIELKKTEAELSFRGSVIHAVLGATLARGFRPALVLLNLVAFVTLVAWARKLGAPVAFTVPWLLTSWSGLEAFLPGSIWLQSLALWTGLALALRLAEGETAKGWRAIGALGAASGVCLALISLDSLVFLPLAVVPLGALIQNRGSRVAAVASVCVLSLLAAVGLIVGNLGGAAWWTEGKSVVLAPEAWDSEETRPLVLPQQRASKLVEGISGSRESFWAIPDTFFGPFFAYPLVLIAIGLFLAYYFGAARKNDSRLDVVLLPCALLIAAWSCWPGVSPSRAGPQEWAALYPLLLLLPMAPPRKLTVMVQLAAVAWAVSVLRVVVS